MSSPLRDLFDPRVHFPLVPDSASGSSSAERHSTSGDKALPPLLVVEAPSSWHEESVSTEDTRLRETSLDTLQREGAAASLTSGECMHESEPFFRMSESALARLEAGLRAQEKKQPHRAGQLPPVVGLGRMEGRGLLPRAGQLPPAFGLHAVESEGSNEASPETCSRPQTVLPLVHERSPSQAPKERRLNSGAVVLIAGVIAVAVAVAYYFSTAGVTPELASIGTQPVEQSPKPIATPTETKVNKTSGEENDQGGGKSASQAEASFSRPAVSGTSIEIATPSLSTTVPPRPHRNRKVRHSGNAAQTKSP